MTSFQEFDSYEELLKAMMPEADQVLMPEFEKPTEDVQSTQDLLDLISFIKKHELNTKAPKYHRLVQAEKTIIKFNQMIGLDDAKAIMATQILSLCDTNVNTLGSQQMSNDMHCVLYGPPGCGKTTMANTLAELYLELGIIQNGKIIRGDRANLIGEYVGETAIKTKKVLESALGGVFFLDEAYQLGHAADGNRDSFAYECINTIVQFITENKGKLVMILAGYENDIKGNFFAQNAGLDRRFPFKYRLKGYNEEQLLAIFELQAKQRGYELESGALDASFFKTHEDYFKFYGGDTENFFSCCKMIHDKRMFSTLKSDKILNSVDISKGFLIFQENKKTNKDDAMDHEMSMSMYS